MESVIFIGTNKSGSSREAVKAAKKIGYETILLTNNKKFLANKWEFPDIDLMLYVSPVMDYEIVSKEITFLRHGERKIKAILSFIEPYVYLAASLSVEFCSSSLSLEAIDIMEDKSLVRNVLRNSPVTPYFKILNNQSELETFHFNTLPLVIKSPFSTGSKDVLLARTKEELDLKVNQLLLKYPLDSLIVEEFLEGPQYLVEVIVKNGEIFIIGVIEQTISEYERFIVTGYSFNPKNHELTEKVREVVQGIVEGIKLTNGSCHIELRLVNGTWKLIETNPRVSGGAMNRMIEIGTGINIAEETIKLYAGESISISNRFEKCVYTQYITVGQKGRLLKVTGRARAEALPGVQEVYIKPKKGMTLKPPESMGDRYGYVIAAEHSIEAAKDIALTAAKEIAFYLEPL
ncbi:ATP-grasp domain-containing protein [Bacillus luteolus]|uniref:ATP-grasp domain-containing protein n=1 Tax=Litchfieldia luteola TaxID=682179 RepID=A0ABR9QLQ8_9BACI|nr:ATP-grasp domain-containing protein [Cytobacillus luteolus]MBE4909422.1 ATP-grasp domain-containing protein [Cytobacillus luteolus]MBP1940822.1 biotin carboxylase [Cytobacillus luteolus]